ncbi:junctional adhesion molecule-like [Panulirus ornatus]|uniref:junctional adhesion molecule-like n=1 Tax=Panulirus ornatus TaxID=150431 RepID=UPI003A8C74EF
MRYRLQLLPLGVYVVLGCVAGKAGAGTGLYMGPYFPSPQPQNITVHQNTVAYLPCTVNQLGDKSVSWVRQRDADILTVDRYTFVRDDRLTVHFTPDATDTGTWTLVIKYVQERDAGTYECQISTEPKMSMLVHLNVIVPQVEVTGAADKYVRSGSTARLECKVSSTVQLPDYIFWYHSGERLLEHDNPRVKITVSRRGGQGSEMSVTSTLVISNARPSDAGNYTCLPSNLHSATTVLHVLNDEHPAAMHTGAAMRTEPPPAWGILLVVVLTLLLVHVYPHTNHTQEWMSIYVRAGPDESVRLGEGSIASSVGRIIRPAHTRLPAAHIRCVPHAHSVEELLSRRRPPSTKTQPVSSEHQQGVSESVGTGSVARSLSLTETASLHTEPVSNDLNGLH